MAKAKGSVFGQSQDNFVIHPHRDATSRPMDRGTACIQSAIDQQHRIEAEDEARVLLRSFRHLGPEQEDNFSMFASGPS